MFSRALFVSWMSLGFAAPLASQVDSATGVQRGLRDRAELEAFVDGVMAVYLRERHVAGATVSVVKDGTLFFAKGYGFADVDQRKPVDPARSLFRIGSISKLFTWTAVMQLVEQGKLDLNKDVNAYLDFEIPATYPEPITLTHILTHTPGFEEDARDLFTEDPASIKPMGHWLPAHMPKRVRPPGTFSSYSNWATALAGYIVERVSGMSWDEYIERNILDPLGMVYTTGRQPLPERFAADMSQGYSWTGGRYLPKKWEIVTGAPAAGSMAASAHDMAKFMIAHLNDGELDGRRILAPETARKMHERLFTHDPRLNGFAHGFYEQSSNGVRIYGHGGDTRWFHSDLALIPEHNVGVFVSYNTDRGGALTGPFVEAFLDHYFPTPLPVVDARPGRAELERFAGQYLFNRMSYSTFMKAMGLTGAVTVQAGDSGVLIAKMGSDDLRLVQVDSLLFRDLNSDLLVAFRTDPSGRVSHAFINDAPMMAMERLDGAAAPRLHVFILVLGLVLFTLTVIAAIVRRFTSGGRPVRELPGRGLLVGLSLAFLLGAVALVASGIDLEAIFTNRLGKLKFALVFPVIGALLTLGAVVAMVRQWRTGAGTVAARLRYGVVVIVALLFIWSLNSWNLLGWRM